MSDEGQPVQIGTELHRDVEDAFSDFMLNRPFDCGFDPNDEDPDRKGEIDMFRSQALRCMFLNTDFGAFVTKAAQEVMDHELNTRWSNGESLNASDVEQLRHLMGHVSTDLLNRLMTQAIEPFVANLIREGRYSRNGMYPTHDFTAAQQPPQE
jgi:hypothetical protein